MNLGVEGLIVAVTLILPGFVASRAQAWVTDRPPTQANQWIAVSLLRGFILNGVGLVIVVWWTDIFAIGGNFATVKTSLNQITVEKGLTYLGGIYVAAILYGLVIGFVLQRGRETLFTRGWTPISPYPDVWTDVLSEKFETKENLSQKKKKMKKTKKKFFTPQNKNEGEIEEVLVPWIRVQVDDSCVLIGRLYRSSEKIDKDKPFEVFLTPVFQQDRQTGQVKELGKLADAEFLGIYLRIHEEALAEIFSAVESWRPKQPQAHSGSTEDLGAGSKLGNQQSAQ